MITLAPHAHLRPQEQKVIDGLVWDYRAFKQRSQLINGLAALGVPNPDIEYFVALVDATED